MESTQSTTTPKTRLYNLIILDKSGSMSSIQEAAYQGCNEVLNGLRATADKNKDEQEIFVSLRLFDTESMPYIFKNEPASKVRNLQASDYQPCACTPLYDAIGSSLTELEKVVDQYDDAIGLVTIITDGYENASVEYSGKNVIDLIERLKNKGWTFAYMGANHDVEATAKQMGIKNTMRFESNDSSMRESWRKEQQARDEWYDRKRAEHRLTICFSKSDRQNFYRQSEEDNDYYHF